MVLHAIGLGFRYGMRVQVRGSTFALVLMLTRENFLLGSFSWVVLERENNDGNGLISAKIPEPLS